MTSSRNTGHAFHRGDDMLAMVEEVAKVGHWRFEVATRALTWSDAVYRLHGIDVDGFALTIDRALAFYHPDDAEDVRSILDEALASGRPFAFDRRIVTPRGEVRHVYCRGVCERDGSGVVVSLFGTVMDISALKLAEQAACESEMRFRRLAESTSDVITRLDAGFRREYVSPACLRMFGFTPEEMVGTIPSDSIHPDDQERVQESARQLIDGEIASGRNTNTYRTRHKDGRWIWVEAGMSLAREGAAGERIVLICSLRDVTERKCAEAALAASEARFRAVAENTNELIIVGYDDGSRSYISPASTRILGYTPQELMGMHVRDYVHPDDIARLYAATSPLGTGATEVSIVYRAKTRTGAYIWAEGIFRRIDGALPGDPTIVSTYRDVTESRAQAEALAEAKAIAERERAAAESASEAKTDFLAAMSHEIRTPLNAIIGYAELLADGGGLGAEQRGYLGRIRTSGAALLTVVNDILDFSKIEAGQVELDAAPFSLAAFVDATLSIIGGQAAGKGLTLDATIAEGLPGCFVGDEARLRQVLLNLLNNAVKFTPSGGVSLDVGGRAEDDLVRLSFAVRDTGIGIPADKRDRLFERFSQIDGSIRREFGGTGLGLAICKRLVELMGGAITYEAAEGGGSLFRFEVVLRPGALAPDAAGPAKAARRAPSRGVRVLLVEDLEVNQELARLVIEAAGHRVDIAGDGAAALAALAARPYDIVLMDVQMPGMDGMTATRLIRALPGDARRVPIVAMTANVMPAQVASFAAAGMDGHIGKPFERAELHAVIDRWARPPDEAAVFEESARTTDGEIDEEIHREFVELLGENAVRKVLRDLSGQLAERFSNERLAAGDARRVGQDAHTMLSAFAMAGFRRFSSLCARVENACLEGAPLDDLLGELGAARDRVALALAAKLEAAGD